MEVARCGWASSAELPLLPGELYFGRQLLNILGVFLCVVLVLLLPVLMLAAVCVTSLSVFAVVLDWCWCYGLVPVPVHCPPCL